MATQLDPSNIRFSSPSASRIVTMAKLLDWTITWASHAQKAVRLHSPIDSKIILVPAKTSMNAARGRASITQLLTHSDPKKVSEVLDHIDGDLTKDDELAELALMLGLAHKEAEDKREQDREEHLTASISEMVAEAIQVETPIPDIKGDWFAVRDIHGSWFECRDHDGPMRVDTRAGIGGHNRVYHSDSPPMWESAPGFKIAQERAEATEVSRVPWVAKRGGVHEAAHTGRVFEHPYVQQVTYSDGRVVFACALCDYTNNRGRAVAIHVGKRHPERERVEPQTRRITDYPEPEWRRAPTSPRLRADLLSALDAIGETWHSLSREELARRIEEYIVENRPERVPAEPLTDSEILARIAALVDRGEFDHLRHQVASLTDQVVTVTSERDEALSAQSLAQQEVDRELANLTALREMLDDVLNRKQVAG